MKKVFLFKSIMLVALCAMFMTFSSCDSNESSLQIYTMKYELAGKIHISGGVTTNDFAVLEDYMAKKGYTKKLIDFNLNGPAKETDVTAKVKFDEFKSKVSKAEFEALNLSSTANITFYLSRAGESVTELATWSVKD